MNLKPHQKHAVEDLLTKTELLLASSNTDMKYVFEAPTGAGKTIMLGKFLQGLAASGLAKDYVFVWVSVNDLHKQSQRKLEGELGSYRTLMLEDLVSDAALPGQSIVFLNWHTLTKRGKNGEWTNLFVRDGERQGSVPKVLAATRDAGREVIVIVDESHTTYYGKGSQDFIAEFLQPRLTLEVSATPLIKPLAEDVDALKAALTKVPFYGEEGVVESGLIKKETLVNPDIERFTKISGEANNVVIAAALAKRDALAGTYEDEGISVNPLILIQLPSGAQKTTALDSNVQSDVEAALMQHGLSYEDGTVAIWLSGEKRNLDDIEDPQSPVKALIFKQAVAVGWDCPRAQVLVMLREMKSLTFQIQTVGRILRMPEAVFYSNDELNKAFVFTNLENVQVDHTSAAFNFFKVQKSHLRSVIKDQVANIVLPNYYRTRAGNYGDITASGFSVALRNCINESCQLPEASAEERRQAVAMHLDLDPGSLTRPLLANAVVTNWDTDSASGQLHFETLMMAVSEGDLQRIFDELAENWAEGYAVKRSAPRVKTAIYGWFKTIGITDEDEVQRVIACSAQNQEFFTEHIEEAKERYRKFRETPEKNTQRRRSQEALDDLVFTMPEEDYFSEAYEEVPAYRRYTHEPCLLQKKRSVPEQKFERLLEESDCVQWWYKNGEGQQRYFAVEYSRLGPRGRSESGAFYPDFLVFYKDGTLGVYDTKEGATLIDPLTELKSNALHAYLKARDAQGMQTDGGIVTPHKNDPTRFTICRDPQYETPTANNSKWEPFALSSDGPR